MSHSLVILKDWRGTARQSRIFKDGGQTMKGSSGVKVEGGCEGHSKQISAVEKKKLIKVVVSSNVCVFCVMLPL